MKGKAAIDGFGSRLGKSGASVVHQGLIMIFGSISLSTPLIGTLVLIVIGGWIAATRVLGKEFGKLTVTDETLEVSEQTPIEEKQPGLASTEM
jgi:AAA family ATP:ADP antiporter